ncbi:MAG: hypothetical protein UX91_C0002G0023 [Candidatus Amesbacteria bacterium GW2011_GWB1_47_19]|nr:MAG: hypothetical protein UW51_C0004G0023 [Candidatus Amesbacteria bacterium GW2011_GWA1_44_24]KKU31698.1 MAG: Inositol monophosphatase [Candidatus Amesbacteria bacterium GW2011_GWC1_46_24]KKU67611.1 MAG: hypothetical protein UX91_C0002G0023 [Candidatus Amesbacteria bacterium GW2011_GWB1_47_19]OGD06461.1 MAG: hypothetical protein A2379_02365 [Candidatus Amesbacteria bacterium RIFOXYB1_FULL_47_13]HBC72865.1 hypothetical protein [Candidatus Amesbacteria bacterium]
MKLSPEAKTVVELVRECGLIARQQRLGDLSVEDVAGKGLISKGDLKVDGWIKHRVGSLFPGYVTLSEESENELSFSQLQMENVIVADPIDGTRWYKDGGNLWTISLALVVHGVINIGVIHQPDTNTLWLAEKGQGAYRKRNGKRPEPIKTLNETKLSRVKIGVGSNMSTVETRRTMLGLLNYLIEDSRGPYIMASTALELALVASGIVLAGDIHPQAKPWDKAAGMLIIEEAGGAVGGWPGRETVFENGLVAAANLMLYNQLVELVKAAECYDKGK